MNKFPFEQLALIIVAIIYLLESIMIAGLFTNILIFGILFLVFILALLMAIFKKSYKWILIDVLIFILCSSIAFYLYSL